MGNFEKISKMNLSELEAPEEVRKREAEVEAEAAGETGEAEAESKGAGTEETGTGMLSAEQAGETAGKTEVDDGGSAASAGKPKEIMEPQGRHYYFDTEISQKNVTSFLFGHTYRQPIILIATLFAIIWPIVAVVKKQDNLYLPVICALFILLWLPFSTWNRGKSVKKQNPLYQQTFHYMFDEWGLHLKLSEDALDVEWRRITKVMELKTILVLYTGKSNAFIIPTETMGERREEMTAFLKEKAKKK